MADVIAATAFVALGMVAYLSLDLLARIKRHGR
jgi:hypothetical protein